MRTLAVILITILLCGCGGGSSSSSSNSACSRIIGEPNRIIAGGEACGGQSAVALILVDSSAGVGSCSGSYISQTAVLTAAHCFPGRVREVAIGSLGNIRSGVQVIIHPLYDGSISSPFDMAIVKVNQPLSAGPVPILLSRFPNPGERVVAYGYGLDERGNDALDRINSGQAPLRATFTQFAGSLATAAVVSTGAGSTCQGDSGGPVLAKDQNGNYGIVGITRAGPNGCSAEQGRLVSISSTQTNGAIDFISAYAPDFAVN